MQRFGHTATQLLFMRALLGIAEAAYIPAATALIAEHHGSDTRARAIGIHLAGFSVGMVCGGSIAGFSATVSAGVRHLSFWVGSDWCSLASAC